MTFPRYLLAGDQGLVVEFGDAIDPDINRRVRDLFVALDAAAVPGIVDLVPTYRSLLITYDPLRLPPDDLRKAVEGVQAELASSPVPAPHVLEVPTAYGGEFGPDLAFVASHNGLSEEDVVRIHSGTDYLVYMMGFSPGFPYLGGMSNRIAAPRLATPRTAIPAGSVGIAQTQTGIYPVESPGGWQLIGRTPVKLFDPERQPPVLVEAGDYIRFVPISHEECRRSSSPDFNPSQNPSPSPSLSPNRNPSATLLSSGPHRNHDSDSDRDGDGDWNSRNALLEVLDGGLLTTVQDTGRFGYQRYGVPVSGAMDWFALRAANRLAGNEDAAAALEITLLGPQLRFLAPASFALAGAELGATVDGRPVSSWETVTAAAGQVLAFGGVRDGVRAYLAVTGGIDVPPVLGSRSTYTRSRLGGYEGRALKAGDVVRSAASAPAIDATGRRVPPDRQPTYGHEHRLRVILGPQDDRFTDAGILAFFGSTYTVTAQSDRMGCRLSGPKIEHKTGPDLVSDGSPFGGVQVAGDGQPIVLMTDRGTAGGYTKIATVISADIWRLAQAAPGDSVRFEAVSIEDAVAARREQEAWLDEIVASRVGSGNRRVKAAVAAAAVAKLLSQEGP